jgi:ADP-ribose pyrophosphatase YjhB (NUDIX family)
MANGTGRTIIRAGRLIDGTGAAPQTDVALIIDGSKISSIEPWREELRPGATVYEFPVETVLPGLVDAHCHLSLLGAGLTYEEEVRNSNEFMAVTAAYNAQVMLKSGVTLGVRALVVDSLRGVLLVRHTYMPGFHLPGGGVDPGESAREAALRELLEETGVAAEHAELVGLYFNKSLGNRDHVAVFAVTRFVCPPGGTLTTSREIAEAGFFPLDDLPAATTAPTRRRLKEYLSGAAPAEIW